ncbi:hypothetical protein L1765_13090 [Microaerobacter geothermalis]|uniref:hypothetical protein n=1 Tax=Microaerobacter geothermalis TaxID=674972 RepID=UPI001F430DCA|nr:hypothetical protein [Microaerobacter geothermalis]MCF6094896.1 hypothetical protein [Microaerobacter geothermalis]
MMNHKAIPLFLALFLMQITLVSGCNFDFRAKEGSPLYTTKDAKVKMEANDQIQAIEAAKLAEKKVKAIQQQGLPLNIDSREKLFDYFQTWWADNLADQLVNDLMDWNTMTINKFHRETILNVPAEKVQVVSAMKNSVIIEGYTTGRNGQELRIQYVMIKRDGTNQWIVGQKTVLNQ